TQSRIGNRLNRLGNGFPVCALLGAQIRWPLQQFNFFLIDQRAHGPFARFKSVLLMPVKLAGELDEIVGRERAARFVSRVIAPDTQRYAIAGVGKNKLAIWLLFASQFWVRTLNLHVHARRHRAVLGGPASFSEPHY